jgi:hypothetical protein
VLEFLPEDVRNGLDAARKNQQRRKSRLRVCVKGETFPVLRMWGNGFSVARGVADHLRGFVDNYDGSRHLYQALIVATDENEFEMSFEFKRSTAALDGPPLDYDRPDDAPVALLSLL